MSATSVVPVTKEVRSPSHHQSPCVIHIFLPSVLELLREQGLVNSYEMSSGLLFKARSNAAAERTGSPMVVSILGGIVFDYSPWLSTKKTMQFMGEVFTQLQAAQARFIK